MSKGSRELLEQYAQLRATKQNLLGFRDTASQIDLIHARLHGDEPIPPSSFTFPEYEQYANNFATLPLFRYTIQSHLVQELGKGLVGPGRVVDWGAGRAEMYCHGSPFHELLTSKRCTVIPIEPNGDALKEAVASGRVSKTFQDVAIRRTQPPYGLHSVDAMYSISALHTVPQTTIAAVLSEGYKMLKPGGVFVNSHPFIGKTNFMSGVSDQEMTAAQKHMSILYPNLQFSMDSLASPDNFITRYGNAIGQRLRDQLNIHKIQVPNNGLFMEGLVLNDLFSNELLNSVIFVPNRPVLAQVVEGMQSFFSSLDGNDDVLLKNIVTVPGNAVLKGLTSIFAMFQADLFNSLLMHQLEKAGFQNVRMSTHSDLKETSPVPGGSVEIVTTGHAGKVIPQNNKLCFQLAVSDLVTATKP